MKTYIIINGLNTTIIDRPTITDARHAAINMCDHSNEVIIREVNNIVSWSLNRIHTIQY